MQTAQVSEALHPGPALEVTDICKGADPFIFKQAGMWHLLLQDDVSQAPLAHDGLIGYSLRSAPTIEGLAYAKAQPLQVASQEKDLRQVWAGEIFGNYLYVATSNGDNITHRMRVYKTEGSLVGPWVDLGLMKYPKHDDAWAIDLTLCDITVTDMTKRYAVWSGWEMGDPALQLVNGIVPQYIYIAELLSPTELGPRVKIASPTPAWSHSVAPILEGPQAVVIDGTFTGITVAVNASWTTSYNTALIRYTGGDPLDPTSWNMPEAPLFIDGHGIGHGMIVQEDDEIYYVGHRKTDAAHGWEDRVVFCVSLHREALLEIAPAPHKTPQQTNTATEETNPALATDHS